MHTHTLLSTDLRENLWRDVWLGVKEVQDVARMLNAVFGCLLWGGEPVVPGSMKVLETTGAIFQLIALTRHNGLLLGHTAERDDFQFLICTLITRKGEHQVRLNLNKSVKLQ